MAALNSEVREPTRQRRVLALLAILAGTAMSAIDSSIANVALPSISAALRISSDRAVLIVILHQCVLAMAVLPASALGDVVGHRRLHECGLLLFCFATLLCLFVSTLPLLLLIRTLQALGAAAFLGTFSALLRAALPDAQLGRGLGLSGIVVASATALAPVLGGAVLAVAEGRWVFVVAAPFALISLLVGRVALPRTKPLATRFDVRGALLSSASFGFLLLGLQDLVYRQGVVWSAGLGALGVACGWLLVRDQRGQLRPILPLDMLRQRPFALSVLSSVLAFTAQMLLLVSLPFRLEQVLHLAPAQVGAALAPWPFTAMIVAPLAVTLSDRIAPAVLGGIGMTLGTVAAAAIALLPAEATQLDIAWRMALCGGGFGLFQSPNARLIISSAPRDRTASAGALVSTARLIGQTLGASLVAILLRGGLGVGAVPALIALSLTTVAAICSFARGGSLNR